MGGLDEGVGGHSMNLIHSDARDVPESLVL